MIYRSNFEFYEKREIEAYNRFNSAGFFTASTRKSVRVVLIFLCKEKFYQILQLHFRL